MADLNALIVPADSGVLLNAAVGLNEKGEIVAQGTLPNGDQHAYLLIPCDENHMEVEACDYSWYEAVNGINGAAPVPVAQRADARHIITRELMLSVHGHSATGSRPR